MQHNDDQSFKSTTRPRLARTRFVGMDPAQQLTEPLPDTGNLNYLPAWESAKQPAVPASKTQQALAGTRAARSRLVALFTQSALLEDQSTAHLMQLSGMMRPVRAPGAITGVLPTPGTDEDGYWPLGIQQTGPLPIRNLYGREPFGRTLPRAVQIVMPGQDEQMRAPWQKALASPILKISLGLLVGIVLLVIAARFVDFANALHILGAHLGTPQGIGLALLAGLAYLAGHSIRGLRWKLFLNPVGKVDTLKVIELAQVAVFLNFLLPMRAGEAAKSLVLKRIAATPISKSLPTVAMDKSLDLLPVLLVVALFPVLSVAMDLRLWLLLALADCVLIVLILFTGLMIWKRDFALKLLQKSLGWLPRAIGAKIEGFVTGFVDALLAAARRPAIFLPALLLTCGAVVCDALFALLAFQVIGLPVSLGTALAGYILYTLFSILPTPPAQIGSNEVAGLLIFSGLLHLPGASVVAMYLFAHLWTALIMTATGLSCLTALGLTMHSAMHPQSPASSPTPKTLP
ncbi:MAG TPA: lysylphosphatidylglycerol synthase transmembrane domain-containing protein [Ktedonobacteraceae bacterium]|nr:lysylphosphatidylglycerol synthase transmembrane domain-containing protein [Ktedonobacteraceae bacterium]